MLCMVFYMLIAIMGTRLVKVSETSKFPRAVKASSKIVCRQLEEDFCFSHSVAILSITCFSLVSLKTNSCCG